MEDMESTQDLPGIINDLSAEMNSFESVSLFKVMTQFPLLNSLWSEDKVSCLELKLQPDDIECVVLNSRNEQQARSWSLVKKLQA